MDALSDDPFSPADLAKAAAELALLPDDDQVEFDQLKVYLAGIGADEFLDLFKNTDITSETLPFITATDLAEIGIPVDRISEISDNLTNLRPVDNAKWSPRQHKLFDRYSTYFSEEQANAVRKDCIKQITYLTGVTRQIKRQIRGFGGEIGTLERAVGEFRKEPADTLLEEISRIQKTIGEIKNS